MSADITRNLNQWLALLMAPGSSLGGARPKANILDKNGHPWIAKFPSRNDTIDKAKWEYLAYQLALSAGIAMKVAPYFRLNIQEAETILTLVRRSVSLWEKVARQTGIMRNEIEFMRSAFRC